jgi:hypothetical protein
MGVGNVLGYGGKNEREDDGKDARILHDLRFDTAALAKATAIQQTSTLLGNTVS